MNIKWKVEDAYKILTKDPVMKKIVKSTGRLEHGKQQDVYFALLRSITSQQLSTKAAETIFNRFLDLFPERNPEASLLVSSDIEKLRACGLSYSKAGYLKNIAGFSLNNGLEYKKMNKLDDEDLILYLTSIKGVGRWTAEMILMFTMNRPDILPVDDLGIKNAIKHHYGIRGEGKVLVRKMVKVAESWRPYRTLASRHLWRYKDEVK